MHIMVWKSSAGLLTIYVAMQFSAVVIGGNLQEQYIGCFYDAVIRTLPGGISSLKTDKLTIDLCLQYCQELNTTYAGLQTASTCLCLDDYGLALLDDSCNVVCPGNGSEFCGGSIGQTQTYALYSACQIGTYGIRCDQPCHCEQQVPCNRISGQCPNKCEGYWYGPSCNEANILEYYVGCYADNSSRSLNIIPYEPDSNQNTIEKCINACVSLNWSYAGLQFGTECYCGETYNKYGIASANSCSMNCSGNGNEICGGAWANSVYSVCPRGYFGMRCTSQCHCYGQSRCKYLDGSCNAACDPGWTGNSCNVRECSVNNGGCPTNTSCVTVNLKFSLVIVCRNFTGQSAFSLETVIGAAVGSAGGAILICASIVIVICLCRRRQRTNLQQGRQPDGNINRPKPRQTSNTDGYRDRPKVSEKMENPGTVGSYEQLQEPGNQINYEELNASNLGSKLQQKARRTIMIDDQYESGDTTEVYDELE